MSQASTWSLRIALGLVLAAGVPGCAAMINDAGLRAVSVPPQSPLQQNKRIGILQAVCTGACTPEVLQAAASGFRETFLSACYDVVEAPELMPFKMGIGINTPNGPVGLDMGLTSMGIKVPGQAAGLQFNLPPGLDQAMADEAAKKYGIAALVYPVVNVGEPNNINGFRPVTLSFSLLTVGTRSNLMRGTFQSSMMTEPNAPDFSGLFMVLQAGIQAKGSVCPVTPDAGAPAQ